MSWLMDCTTGKDGEKLKKFFLPNYSAFDRLNESLLLINYFIYSWTDGKIVNYINH